METMHENCPHPRTAVQRFGGRRRRCRICGKTWSVHARRRGPKHSRSSTALLTQLLVAGVPTKRLCRDFRCTAAALQKRCQFAIRQLADRPHVPVLPDGPLVLVADALRMNYQRQEWTLYNMAIKPVATNTASLWDPILLVGRESASSWRQAIEQLSPSVRQNIKALVSDGLPGSDAICHEQGWIHQRCHWHILAVFMGSRMRRHRRETLLGKIRDVIYMAVRLALNTTDPERLQTALGVLETILPMIPKQAWKLPGIIRQFIADIDAFRAYQRHPELGLPVTTAVVESLHSRLRTITLRTHSADAVRRRAACFVRLRPTMTCRARKHQQN